MHMTGHPGNLSSSTPVNTPTRITVHNVSSLPITHVGSTSFPSSYTPITMYNVLVSPDLVTSLFSVRCLTCENRLTVEFDSVGFFMKDAHTRMVLHRCDSPEELYHVHAGASTSTPVTATPPVCVKFLGVFLSHVISSMSILVRPMFGQAHSSSL